MATCRDGCRAGCRSAIEPAAAQRWSPAITFSPRRRLPSAVIETTMPAAARRVW